MYTNLYHTNNRGQNVYIKQQNNKYDFKGDLLIILQPRVILNIELVVKSVIAQKCYSH